MKRTIIISICALMAFAAISCGIAYANAAPSIFGSGKSSGTTNGVACGAALNSLYTQYKADGKIDTKNISNIVNLATLANGVESLKGQSDKSTFFKDFATGLIAGSRNLVTSKTAGSVTSTLSSLANLDLSALGDAAAAVAGNASGSSATASASSASASASSVSAAATASSAISELTSALGSNNDVNTAVNTLSSLFSSFGK